MILHLHLRKYVIQPVLKELEEVCYIPATQAAEELLVLTVAKGKGGVYLHQPGGGPGCGIYMMEPSVALNVLKRAHAEYLPAKGETLYRGTALYTEGYHELLEAELCGNLLLATILARLFYHFQAEKLPEATDIEGLAQYWARHWPHNHEEGAADFAAANYLQYLGLDTGLRISE